MKRTRKPTWEPLSGVPGVSDEAVYDENTRVTRAETREPVYPDQYLYVEECCSGQQWIRPLRASAKLDLTAQVKRWIRDEFDSEYRLDGSIVPKLQGDYYASLLTDGRPPYSAVVWDSGGFYLRGNWNE